MSQVLLNCYKYVRCDYGRFGGWYSKLQAAWQVVWKSSGKKQLESRLRRNDLNFTTAKSLDDGLLLDITITLETRPTMKCLKQNVPKLWGNKKWFGHRHQATRNDVMKLFKDVSCEFDGLIDLEIDCQEMTSSSHGNWGPFDRNSLLVWRFTRTYKTLQELVLLNLQYILI